MYSLLKELNINKPKLARQYIFCSKMCLSMKLDHRKELLIREHIHRLHNHVEGILKANTINVYSAIEDLNKLGIMYKYFGCLVNPNNNINCYLDSVQSKKQNEFRAVLLSINNKILIFLLEL